VPQSAKAPAPPAEIRGPGAPDVAGGLCENEADMKIRFGTDGWRGVISRDFTFDNVRRLTWAIAAYFEEQGLAGRGVAVGYDRRFLSAQYAAEAAGVLAARGVPVRLATEYLPTPAVAWAVRDQELAGGIVITASHNPPEWNGIKFKESFGGSSRGSVNERVEEILDGATPPGEEIACLPVAEARGEGIVGDLEVWESYTQGLRRLVDFPAIRTAGLTVAVDPMYGCSTPWLRLFLEEAGCRVVEIHNQENPGFGGVPPEPSEGHLTQLMEMVAREGWSLGLANDGDGDRIGAVDERGRYFSPQRILTALLRYLREFKGLSGDVAKAVSASSMIDLLAEKYRYDVILTPIGFKYIGEVMLEREILIGGEESGGIGIPAHLPDRDGLLNALLLAEIVARTGRGLRAYIQEVFDEVGYFTYDRVDLELPPQAAEGVRARTAAIDGVDRLAGKPVRDVVKLDGTKFVFDDHSWLLVRPSGTEPVLRVYAEARSRDEVQALLDEGRRLAGL
jgi:alpha-D-glucose phosphate-specific phosphoglucomutase